MKIEMSKEEMLRHIVSPVPGYRIDSIDVNTYRGAERYCTVELEPIAPEVPPPPAYPGADIFETAGEPAPVAETLVDGYLADIPQ